MTSKVEKVLKLANFDQKWPPNSQKWFNQKSEKNVLLYFAIEHSCKISEKFIKRFPGNQLLTDEDDDEDDDDEDDEDAAGRRVTTIAHRPKGRWAKKEI